MKIRLVLAAAFIASAGLAGCGLGEETWADDAQREEVYDAYLCNQALNSDNAAASVFVEILAHPDDYTPAEHRAAIDGMQHLQGATAIGSSNLEIDKAGDGTCNGWLWNMYRDQHWDEAELAEFTPQQARDAGVLE
ncbi:hypothetical protein [Corynebacterium sp. H113]|uniref:hypothetical protein n=1 Tax=Corynebacterium sp. H113 TaxID=3133419 RepID=UPI0030AD5695